MATREARPIETVVPARNFTLTVDDLAALNDLIARHNRYYPIEANLPSEVRTGRLLDRGSPGVRFRRSPRTTCWPVPPRRLQRNGAAGVTRRRLAVRQRGG